MNILADTCFWISLCDPMERDHSEAVSMMEKIMRDQCHTILVPHPVLYETLCSNMVKKPEQVKMLVQYFKKVLKVSDAEYVEDAYRLVEQQANMSKGAASMVDIAIMLIAEDINNNVKAILTKNGRDFASFCQKNNISMVSGMELLKAI